MKRLLKSFKTEINPTEEQKARIRRTIGICRYVYNFYLGHNKALHDNGEKFMTGKSFSLWLNNEYIPNNPDKTWIREAYSKAVKSLSKMDVLLYKIFKHQSDFPKFKKKGKSDVKMHLSEITQRIVNAKGTDLRSQPWLSVSKKKDISQQQRMDI